MNPIKKLKVYKIKFMSKKISSKHYCSQWTSDLADRNSPIWSLGIEIIKDRFKARFFNPIKLLIEHDTREIRGNSGFLIMSIDCLLIETLNQFYLGLKSTDENYSGRNWEAFRDFFRYSQYFPDFNKSDALSKLFFEQIRCGLLHQAESKVNSLINIKDPSNMVVAIDEANDYSKGVVINRNLFHKAL
jgi:hypothetical protein